MSQENVEVVKELVAASQLTRMPRGAVGVGRDAVWDFYRQWFETWDRLEITPERFIDAGDRVIVVVRIAGIGKGSGIETSMRAADVMTLREGYPDASEALEVTGFSDEPAAR